MGGQALHVLKYALYMVLPLRSLSAWPRASAEECWRTSSNESLLAPWAPAPMQYGVFPSAEGGAQDGATGDNI